MADDATTLLQRRLDRLRAGDASARDELLSATCERLTRLARKMLKGYPTVQRWEQTDDVLQNAVLRLRRALEGVTPATVREYFGLAALQVRRELVDLVRHYYGPLGQGAHHLTEAGHPEGGPNAPEPGDLTGDPGRLAAWAEFHRQIGALPADEREVVELLWYQGLSQAEAAAVMGISERTVQRHWQSARLRLRAALGDALPT
jgi:RNA polymerase sigma-70 factor (ECF subfamily)